MSVSEANKNQRRSKVPVLMAIIIHGMRTKPAIRIYCRFLAGKSALAAHSPSCTEVGWYIRLQTEENNPWRNTTTRC